MALPFRLLYFEDETKITVMRTSSKAFRAVFAVISVAVISIWLALILTGHLGIIGNLVFLGGAAWIFELYSVAQREGFDASKPGSQKQRPAASPKKGYSLSTHE